jgi:hypothetical protein
MARTPRQLCSSLRARMAGVDIRGFFWAAKAKRKKEVCGQPTVGARARARDGSSRSRWGALAEQGEAGSGFGSRPLPCQCGSGVIAPVWVS